MRKKQILPWIAVVLSVGAIAVAMLRSEPVSIDWMATSVAILSTLVLILMGWQIYTTLDILKRIKNSEMLVGESMKNLMFQQYRSQCAVYGSLSEFYRMQGVDLFNYARYTLLAIQYGSLVGDYEYCNSLIKVLHESIEVDATVRESEKIIINSLLATIPDHAKIDKFNELMESISRIKC